MNLERYTERYGADDHDDDHDDSDELALLMTRIADGTLSDDLSGADWISPTYRIKASECSDRNDALYLVDERTDGQRWDIVHRVADNDPISITWHATLADTLKIIDALGGFADFVATRKLATAQQVATAQCCEPEDIGTGPFLLYADAVYVGMIESQGEAYFSILECNDEWTTKSLDVADRIAYRVHLMLTGESV